MVTKLFLGSAFSLMRNRFFCFALCVFLLLGGCSKHVDTVPPSASSALPSPSLSPTPSPSPTAAPIVSDTSEATAGVYVNEQKLPDAFVCEFNQTTYISLLDILFALHPNAVVTAGNTKTEINSNALTVTVYHQLNYLIANERYLYLPSGILIENDQIMLPAKTLAQMFGAQVQIVNDSIYFTSNSGAILSGSQYYDPDEVFWLSHLIHAESGNQSLYGKIAVGNVVLNRVSNPIFPDTIYDVIFQPGQFYDSYSGAITLEPSAESVIAAKLCLDGATVVPNAYWFNGAGIPCWASENKSLLTVIGSHAFYG